MKYRRLGRTNLFVSEIGHGLWGMGGWSGSDDAQSLETLQTAVNLGCNFFDTAHAYGEGRSDRLLGKLLRQNRDRTLYVAAKVPPLNRKWPASPRDRYNDVFPVDHIKRFADVIRRDLDVDQIDLLQLHVWDDAWAGDQAWRDAVRAIKESGVIKWFGISLNRWEPTNGLRAISTGLVDTVQVIYNIFDQAPEDSLFPACKAHDVGVIARVPLDEGSLAGNLTANTRFPAEDWRAKYFGPENLPPTLTRIAAIKEALPAGMTLAQLALRFILSNPDVATTLVGMRRKEHVRENTDLADGRGLDPDLLLALRKHRWDREVTPWAN